MNNREISEIRRRIRPEKNNIGRVRGCYVTNKTVVSEFNLNFQLISTDEAEELLSVLRKIFSGSIGRNLIDISFTNQQVLESDEHKLLSTLRNSALTDDEAIKTFYNKTVSSLELDGSYLLLLANDKYDVYTFSADGEKEDSAEMFSYIMCAVCPIKSSKPTLSYALSENNFKNLTRDSIICAPELGFMFPAFDTRKANIYNALYYTRSTTESHTEYTDAIFNSKLPKPAAEQTEELATIINSAVADECDIEFVQAIQSQLVEITQDHKNNKIDEPLVLSEKDIGSLLRCGGVGEDTVNEFTNKFSSDFGSSTSITPANIMDLKKFEVKTPDVLVKVKAERNDLVETRVIDGTKYILIRADGDVEVNGIKINIK
ncbi:MAG: DUF4317 domain-containing protein [Clostridia bacterium]|nr:DUF4317 domain-containing protein [Clostridia bacterium]